MTLYMPAQSLLRTLIATNTTYFDAGAVTEGDYRVLDGESRNACILSPGIIPELDLSHLVRERHWEAVADLCTKDLDDTSITYFGTLRDSVLSTIIADGNRALSSIYVIVAVSSVSDLIPIKYKDGNGPVYISQRFRIAIDEFI